MGRKRKMMKRESFSSPSFIASPLYAGMILLPVLFAKSVRESVISTSDLWA